MKLYETEEKNKKIKLDNLLYIDEINSNKNLNSIANNIYREQNNTNLEKFKRMLNKHRYFKLYFICQNLTLQRNTLFTFKNY